MDFLVSRKCLNFAIVGLHNGGFRKADERVGNFYKKRMKHSLKHQVKSLAMTVILLIISSVLSAQKIAIIDAGSSGSRLYVYELKNKGSDKELAILYPKQGQEAGSKGRVLSSVANHEDSVKVYLTTMTGKYNEDNDTAKISLYILATAGMRLMPENEADSIYGKIHSEAKELKGFNLEEAMTISGRYEGFYAWMAANYKQKTLTCSGTSYGILEIGGASMQIAFATDGQCPDCISRNGSTNIYSRSYLGGGVDQIYNRNKGKDTLDFDIGLENVSYLYGKDIEFLGQGKPIEIVLEGINNKNTIEDYLKSLQNNDSPQNFHPWINAQYITFVIRNLNLENKLKKSNEKSDWTEGAALDILVNKEMPEKFDYRTKN